MTSDPQAGVWRRLRVRRDAPLAQLSRWRIGGPADLLVEPRDEAELALALGAISRDDMPYVVIGDGSNLLFDDAGFRGVVIRIGRAFAGIAFEDEERITVGGGAWTPGVVRRLITAGREGLVHAVGIPGSFGGLVVMNGGSQRRGVGDHVLWLDVMERSGRVARMLRDDLGFAYRTSRLQDGRRIVLRVGLSLARGDPRALRSEAIRLLSARRRKFPRIRANCGSVFVSDPAAYAAIGPPGEAIERAGLRGARLGDAQISPEHANFIVNLGAARSADVLALIALARARVLDRTGVAMNAEVRYLAPDGRLTPAHDAAF